MSELTREDVERVRARADAAKDAYFAWARYVHQYSEGDGTEHGYWKFCGSDDEGAFRVYRDANTDVPALCAAYLTLLDRVEAAREYGPMPLEYERAKTTYAAGHNDALAEVWARFDNVYVRTEW